jgi:hypothetical protein
MGQLISDDVLANQHWNKKINLQYVFLKLQVEKQIM